MGNMLFVIDDKIEQKFRSAAMRIYGNRKGSISNAGEQALIDWIDANQ